MRLKKNILKMCLHAFIYPICFLVCALVSLCVYQNLEIFLVFISFSCLLLLFNIRFMGVLLLLIFDIIFKNICSQDIKICSINQNVDMASISFNNPTLIDFFDKDSLVLCDIYVTDETNMERLRFYGNKSIFKKELKNIISSVVNARYKKTDNTRFILKNPGNHSYKIIYYNNSKIIKNIIKEGN